MWVKTGFALLRLLAAWLTLTLSAFVRVTLGAPWCVLEKCTASCPGAEAVLNPTTLAFMSKCVSSSTGSKKLWKLIPERKKTHFLLFCCKSLILISFSLHHFNYFSDFPYRFLMQARFDVRSFLWPIYPPMLYFWNDTCQSVKVINKTSWFLLTSGYLLIFIINLLILIVNTIYDGWKKIWL